MAIPVSASDRSTGGAANQAATVAISGVAGVGVYCSGVVWSYSGAPTGGRLTIQSGSDTLLDIDIAVSGPDSVMFPQPLLLGNSAAVTFTLAAGGGGVTGKVGAILWRV